MALTTRIPAPRTELPGVDLERVTFEQAKGWRCALCAAASPPTASWPVCRREGTPHRTHLALGLRTPMPVVTRPSSDGGDAGGSTPHKARCSSSAPAPLLCLWLLAVPACPPGLMPRTSTFVFRKVFH